jgi:hypothetical protein
MSVWMRPKRKRKRNCERRKNSSDGIRRSMPSETDRFFRSLVRLEQPPRMLNRPVPIDRLTGLHDANRSLTAAEAVDRRARFGFNDILVAAPAT